MASTCCRSIAVGTVCCVEISRFGEVNKNPQGCGVDRFTAVEYVEMVQKSNGKCVGLCGIGVRGGGRSSGVRADFFGGNVFLSEPAGREAGRSGYGKQQVHN